MGTTSAATFTTDDERALIYTILGLSAEQMKDYKTAIEQIDKKLAIYRERKDAAAEAAFLNNAGYLHHLNGDYQLAWNAFLQSSEICENEKHSNGVIINAMNLAKMVTRFNNPVSDPSRTTDKRR